MVTVFYFASGPILVNAFSKSRTLTLTPMSPKPHVTSAVAAEVGVNSGETERYEAF